MYFEAPPLEVYYTFGGGAMVILFDIGNTQTVLGVTDDGVNFHKWRFSTQRSGTEDEIFAVASVLFERQLGKIPDVEGAVIASVVPSLNYVFQRLVEKYFGIECTWVEAVNSSMVKWNVKNPSEIGADRVANVFAVAFDHPNALVIDAGTAITIDVVKDGNYEGGVIMPGLMTAVYSLFEKTAKLPQVDLHVPTNCVGKDTSENIRIGIVKGSACALNGLIKEMKTIYDTPPTVFLTGGQSKVLEKLVEHDYLDPDLTLRGMFKFWQTKRRSS
jgi:type III pantothenate kinase